MDPDFIWPSIKRACCMCKRHKIRCVGGRPCLACVKKGLEPEQCIDGCRTCRLAKLICDGKKPCSNCIDSQKECQGMFEATSEVWEDNVTVLAPAELRQSERAKLACLACRRDNKKCDNQRPCERCVAREEECIHVERSRRTYSKRCQACHAKKAKCEDRRPCTACVEDDIVCVEVVHTGGRSRTKKACNQCRVAKIHCDDDRPCHSCIRRGLECDPQTQDDSSEQGIPSDNEQAQFDDAMLYGCGIKNASGANMGRNGEPVYTEHVAHEAPNARRVVLATTELNSFSSVQPNAARAQEAYHVHQQRTNYGSLQEQSFLRSAVPAAGPSHYQVPEAHFGRSSSLLNSASYSTPFQSSHFAGMPDGMPSSASGTQGYGQSLPSITGPVFMPVQGHISATPAQYPPYSATTPAGGIQASSQYEDQQSQQTYDPNFYLYSSVDEYGSESSNYPH